jgi:hypothetical protein
MTTDYAWLFYLFSGGKHHVSLFLCSALLSLYFRKRDAQSAANTFAAPLQIDHKIAQIKDKLFHGYLRGPNDKFHSFCNI